MLVVGGGITGAGVALDAATRGYSVALVERYDWSCGTSSRSSKMVHGGLRYLQSFDLGLSIGISFSVINAQLESDLRTQEQSANLGFDFLGHRFGSEEAAEPRLVELIVELLERGYGAQLLLSQDVAHNSQLKTNGGFGYTYLQQHFLPTLRTAAVGEGEIAQMTIENPRRILTIG